MLHKSVSTRRVFIQKGLTLLAVAPTIPTFLDQTVMALANPEDTSRTQKPSGKDGKILVVLQMSGGNDGLSMVVPYADPTYYRLRPAIAHAANTVLKLDDYSGLNGKLAGLKKMFDNGQMSVVQGVGYPNPNRSHFRSMDIWHSAQPERESFTAGWLGRYFDNTCAGCDPQVGVSMGDTLPPAMQGERIMPISFEQPENFRYRGLDVPHYMALNQSAAAAVMPAAADKPLDAAPRRGVARKMDWTASTQLDFLHRTAMDAQISSDTILRVTRSHTAPLPYPANDFGSGLKTIAAMIAGGLPTRVYYVALGGFDTHAGQLPRHEQLMQQLNDGVSAFWADLKQQGNDDRVMMMTFSEFGRRVAANASNGTDHGAAAPMFLFGKKVASGVVTKHPSMTDLDQGDLKFNTDFRSVYATVLQNWLETPSKPILGQQFGTLPIVKA